MITVCWDRAISTCWAEVCSATETITSLTPTTTTNSIIRHLRQLRRRTNRSSRTTLRRRNSWATLRRNSRQSNISRLSTTTSRIIRPLSSTMTSFPTSETLPTSIKITATETKSTDFSKDNLSSFFLFLSSLTCFSCVTISLQELCTIQTSGSTVYKYFSQRTMTTTTKTTSISWFRQAFHSKNPAQAAYWGSHNPNLSTSRLFFFSEDQIPHFILIRFFHISVDFCSASFTQSLLFHRNRTTNTNDIKLSTLKNWI